MNTRTIVVFYILKLYCFSICLCDNLSLQNQDNKTQCTGNFHPHECNSAFFYRCVDNNKILMQCPHQLFFNTEKQVCDWPPEGKCPTNPTGNCPSRSTFFPDRNNPKYFYQCKAGVFYKYQCPVDMIFNFTIGACEFPGKVATSFQPSKPESELKETDWKPMVLENSHNIRFPARNVTQQQKKVMCYKCYKIENGAQRNHPLSNQTVTENNKPAATTPVNVAVTFQSGMVEVRANETDVIVHFRPKGPVSRTFGILNAQIEGTPGTNGTVLEVRAGGLPSEETAHLRVHLIGGRKVM